MGETIVSGRRRQQRGTERRQALIEAALRVLETEGLEAITHRRVADEAGVALAATTYYFSSKDDLMQATMRTALARTEAELKKISDAVIERGTMTVEEGIEALIAWQSRMLADHRLSAFAEFELFLRVSRNAPYPDDLPKWPAAFVELGVASMRALGSRNPELDGRALVALIHGLVLHALVSQDPDFAETVLAPVIRGWFAQVVPGDR